MKSKLFLVLLGLLILGVISYVSGYSATTDASRTQHTTTADAWSNNSGLSNGTYNVYAFVNSGSTQAGSFGSQHVAVHASDHGSLSQSATANAYVGGYNSSDQYRYSTSSAYIPGN